MFWYCWLDDRKASSLIFTGVLSSGLDIIWSNCVKVEVQVKQNWRNTDFIMFIILFYCLQLWMIRFIKFSVLGLWIFLFLLVYRWSHGSAPGYLASDLQRVSDLNAVGDCALEDVSNCRSTHAARYIRLPGIRSPARLWPQCCRRLCSWRCQHLSVHACCMLPSETWVC